MIVLDASALLALFAQEPGWEVVVQAVTDSAATISAVNYSEVVQKAARHDPVPVSVAEVDAGLEALGITVTPYGRADARVAASFYRHGSGLSMADRACLALARGLASPAYTADGPWVKYAEEFGVEVRLIREAAGSDG